MKKLVSSHFFDVSVSSRSPGWRLLIWLNYFNPSLLFCLVFKDRFFRRRLSCRQEVILLFFRLRVNWYFLSPGGLSFFRQAHSPGKKLFYHFASRRSTGVLLHFTDLQGLFLPANKKFIRP